MEENRHNERIKLGYKRDNLQVHCLVFAADSNFVNLSGNGYQRVRTSEGVSRKIGSYRC